MGAVNVELLEGGQGVFFLEVDLMDEGLPLIKVGRIGMLADGQVGYLEGLVVVVLPEVVG